jgi:ABC-type lipoprotein release transport system permease subunit
MRGYLDTLQVIVLIALRNLFASRLKTLIVGGIILFGSMLVVVGTGLVDSVDASMSRSIIGSVAGHIQVYNAKSKDELTVMGGMMMESPDIAQLDDFKAVRAAILSVPNAKTVVPMGQSMAMVPAGNTVDVVLEKLRDLVRRQQAGEDVQAELAVQKDHVRQIMNVLFADLANVNKIMDAKAITADERETVERAKAPGFWDEFDKDPLGTLEFLENKIAPLASDADMLFLRYVGTDPAAFARSFDRMKIVDGTTIPPGKRGFLFSKWTYEWQVKLKTAHRLDRIYDGVHEQGKTIARDDDLQRLVRLNTAEVKELMLQLDSQQTSIFRTKLQKELGSSQADVAGLLAQFFEVDDQNLDRRYRFFYEKLAPSLTLYRVRVGDILTVKAFTKSGYVQSVNLPVYGTFTFEGLEESHLAGALNLMDMVSFRELYGFATAERDREIAALKAAAGFKEVDRDRAEAELFGGTPEEGPGAGEEAKPLTMKDADAILRGLAGKGARREKRLAASYDPAQLEQGVVLSAAVIVKDPRRIPETIRAIEAAGAKAGLPLKAIDWKTAAGLVGQFVTMIRAVLYISVLIIFAVALVIINNALVMATLERMAEIGTLRAIGAQRRFLLGMLVVETLVVGGVFGGIGAALGVGALAVFRAVGIPASNDTLYFLFSGPRLYPGFSPVNVAIALTIVFLVSGASSVYPGLLAMRVSPRQAMQSDE